MTMLNIIEVIKSVILIFYDKYSQFKLKSLIKRGLVIGENCYIPNDAIIDSCHCWHITIGNNVTFGPRVHILAHDASTKIFLNCSKVGKVKIGNRVFIGASSIILPGVVIGNDVVIGAGSVVTKDVPDGSVAVGNPARVVASINDFLLKKRNEIKIYPFFGEEYTMRKQVCDKMKREMNERMKNRFGYGP